MEFIEHIAGCIPDSSEAEIPWDRIGRLLAPTCFSGMKGTQQNPIYHGEGDVYTHTQMVCRELTRMSEFQELPDRQKTELFLAAILHDVGKVKTTRLEDGNWVSPHHSYTGSGIVRAFLWRDCGICGTREKIIFRETVCALVRHHMIPAYLTEQDDPIRTVREIAAIGEVAEDFSWTLLHMLAKADVKGRMADDIEDSMVKVELSGLVAEEAGCLYKPYAFANLFTKHAYLSGRNVQPDQELYDDTWGEVILLSGLPGTGKDTWIHQNHPEKLVVSLDEIRMELWVRAGDSQAEVILSAMERAKEHLRKQRPFVWNATDLTKETRRKLISLFERYRAKTRIVYLETERETRKARNVGRKEAVPEDAVAGMLEKTVLPTPDEAHTVDWICV